MKKIVMGLVMALMMNIVGMARASSIDWNESNILIVGVNENAVIDFGAGKQLTIAQWVASLPDPEWDAGFAIRTQDGMLPEAEFGYTEVMGVCADNGSGYWSPMLAQFDIASLHSDSVVVFYDLYEWNYGADDWSFVATASSEIGNLDSYVYARFDLNPLTAQEWKPDYFVAVPEPSTALLALLGVGLLFNRRKNTHA